MDEIKSHNTLVIGFNAGGGLAFIRTFDHPEQDVEMRKTIHYVTHTFPTWHVGDSKTIWEEHQQKED